MAEHLRALSVILVLATLVYAFAKAPACATASTAADFDRRRNLWFGITLGFRVPNGDSLAGRRRRAASRFTSLGDGCNGSCGTCGSRGGSVIRRSRTVSL